MKEILRKSILSITFVLYVFKAVAQTAPVVTIPGPQTVLMNNNLSISSGNGNQVTVTDVDNDILLFTITVQHGTYSLANTGGLSGLSGNGTSSLSFSGTDAAIIVALNGSIFTPATGYSGPASVSFTADDQVSGSDTEVMSITVTSPVNEPPVLNNIGSDVTFTEGDVPVTLAGSITVTDGDDDNLVSAAVTFTSGFHNGEDILNYTIPSGSGITLTSSLNGNYLFSGTSSKTNYRNLLRSIQYSNSSQNPSGDIRNVRFTVNDGTVDSDPVTRNITVIPVNDKPVLSGIEATSVSYVKNSAPVVITAGISVTDPDDTSLESAAISITNVKSGDTLAFTNSPGITGQYNNGVLSLSGNATLAAYQNVLRSVTYRNTLATPNTETRNVSFTINDGSVASDPVSRNITYAVNVVPVLQNFGNNLTYTEDDAPITVSPGVTINDSDDPNMTSATVAITTGFQTAEDVLTFTPVSGITADWNTVTGTLSFTGSATKANYSGLLQSIKYSNTNPAPNTTTRVITFTVNDGTVNSSPVSKNIAVTSVNDPPVLSGIESSSLTYVKNSDPIIISNNITVSDTDDMNLESATISISPFQTGDVLTFNNSTVPQINIASYSGGILTLSGNTTKQNYQKALRLVTYENSTVNPNTSDRTITFRINDGDKFSSNVSRTLEYAENAKPVLQNPGPDVSFTEGSAAITLLSPAFSITDGDDEFLASATVSYTSGYQGGEDQLTYTIPALSGITASTNTTTGTITFSGSSAIANYVTLLKSIKYGNTSINPDTTARILSFIVNDGVTNSEPVLKNIDVIAENDPPVLTLTDTQLTYTEGTPVVIASAIGISDPDSEELTRAAIRISNNYDEGEDTLIYTGVLTQNWDETTGTLTLTGNATLAAYQSALRTITFSTADNPADNIRTISFRVFDTSDSSNVRTRNIDVNPVNDAPFATHVTIHAENLNIGTEIRGRFQYNDYESNLPGSHIYRWYSADNATGTNKTVIPGATDTVYKIRQQDEERFIAFEVTPRQINPALTGVAVLSPWIGPVSGTRPTAVLSGGGNICPDGSTAELTITLTGVSPWTVVLRRNTGTISYDTLKNILASPYVYETSKTGTYTISGVADMVYTIPVNTGTGTAEIELITSPAAEISGNALICPGDTASLDIDFTGTAPWNITYTRDGVNPVTVNNITQSSYNLKLTAKGTYQLTGVTSGTATGCVSGTGTVTHRVVPTAVISGGGQVCENTSGNVTVSLTGTTPWNFVYKVDGVITDTVSTTAATRNITVSHPYRTDPYVYTLTEVNDRYCRGTVSGTANVTILKAPEPEITGLKATYSTTSMADTVFGSPAGGDFIGENLIEIAGSDSSAIFLPWSLTIGRYNIIYNYMGDNSCIGSDTAQVNIIDKVADIIFPGYPDNERKIFCKNDAPFEIEGVNVDNVTGSFTISTGTGLVDHGNNKATVYPAQIQGGFPVITYHNSLQTIQESINIGLSPDADFTWGSECFSGDTPILLMSNSTSNNYGEITSFDWKITEGEKITGLTGESVSYSFSSPGNFNIKHIITTSYGCRDSVIKVFPLRETISLSDSFYYENFESDETGWFAFSDASSQTNSWKFGTPQDGFNGASSGSHAWYTQVIPGLHEQSWVVSPCYDFSGTEKPVIKLDIFRQFDLVNKSGAVIQYKYGNSDSWVTLGEVDDGINWYNKYNLEATPGGQSVFGWANIRDNNWTEAKHNLDMLVGKKNVQFRIAYGSTNAVTDNKGIAFDDFWLGERTRMVLLEHFTNASDNFSLETDSLLYEMMDEHPLDVLSIFYHTGFPGDDPFNTDISDSRAFYYGVSHVPYTLLDGGYEEEKRYDYDQRTLSSGDINISSLADPLFDIKVNSTINNNSLQVNAEITATETIPKSELIVHLVVIEKEIQNIDGYGDFIFRNVIRSMLPNSGGNYLFRSWAANEKEFINQSWTIRDVKNQDQLRVIAFIQEPQTGEIYQAAIDKIDGYSGIEEPVMKGLDYMIYPNPASDRIYLKLDQPASGNGQIMIYNSAGVLVRSEIIEGGSESKEIDIFELPEGIYFMKMTTEKQVTGIRKFVKTR